MSLSLLKSAMLSSALVLCGILGGCGHRAIDLNNEAVDLISQDRVREAANILSQAVALRPSQSAFRINYAEALALLGHLEQAVEQSRTALDLQPDNLRAQTQLAELLIANGDLQSAQPIVELLQKQNPHSGYYLYLAGLCAEDATQAQQLYQQSLEQEVQMEVYLALAATLAEQGNAEAALNTLEQAGELESQTTNHYHLLKSACYIQQGLIEDASRQLNLAQQQFPDDPLLALHIGNLYLASGRFSQAQAQFRRASQSPLYQTEANLGRVICLFKEGGRDAQARELCELLRAELGDNDPLLLNLRGLIALRRNQVVEAKQLLQRSLQIQPDGQPGIAEILKNL